MTGTVTPDRNPQARKVLMLTQYLHMGGLERMIFNLSVTLKAQGEWEPQVLVYDRIPDAGPGNDLSPAFTNEGIPVTAFLKPPGFSFRAVLTIRRKIMAENISVLHTHDLGALIYGVCAKLATLGRVRLIHTQHSFIHFSWGRLYKYYERVFVRFADEVAVVSAATQQTYVDLGIPRKKIHIIPNGVHFPEQGPVSASSRKESRTDLVGKLEASAQADLLPFLECRWILYMARLHRSKGQNHAMELWQSLSPLARNRTVLLFVGPGSEPGQLKQLRSSIASAPDCSRILYMGTTHCPELWLSCSDIVLSCSEIEGMPLGPLEAVGAGLPCVLSDIAGHEVMKAWSAQYSLGNPDKGARLIEKILEEIEADPGDYFKRAWERGSEVRSRYALVQMGNAYTRLYCPEVPAS